MRGRGPGRAAGGCGGAFPPPCRWREKGRGIETHLGETERGCIEQRNAKDSLQSKEQNNCDEETDDGDAEPNFGDNLQW